MDFAYNEDCLKISLFSRGDVYQSTELPKACVTAHLFIWGDSLF